LGLHGLEGHAAATCERLDDLAEAAGTGDA